MSKTSDALAAAGVKGGPNANPLGLPVWTSRTVQREARVLGIPAPVVSGYNDIAGVYRDVFGPDPYAPAPVEEVKPATDWTAYLPWGLAALVGGYLLTRKR